jgi:enterochelin esterase-like enzyme
MVLLLAAMSVASGRLKDRKAPLRGSAESVEFSSKVFHNTRSLRVLLPPGYHDKKNAGRRYPVFYLNDGYAVFHYWDAEATVYRLIRSGAIEPLIVVGIDNAGEKERADEYLPYPDETLDPPLPHPHGSLYPQFLVDEVMPYINRRYRARIGPADTGLGGASYGAYIALYTAINRPGVFGKLLLESTPLYIADFRIFKDVGEARGLPDVISIEVGTKETPDDEVNQKVGENARKLEAAMRAASPGIRTRVLVESGASHNAEAWKGRLPGALEFLFGKPKIGMHPAADATVFQFLSVAGRRVMPGVMPRERGVLRTREFPAALRRA